MDKIFPRWGKLKKNKHGQHFHNQRWHFLNFSSQLVGWSVKRSKSYSPLWVELWPKKWKNPLCTLKSGLTVVLQSRLRGCNPGFSTDLGSQVPCRTRIQTGGRVHYWSWWNKYLAPRSFCAHVMGPWSGSLGGIVGTGQLESEGVRAIWSCR